MCNDFLSTLTFIYNQFLCSLHCISHTYNNNLENGGHMLAPCCQNIATYMHHKILRIAIYIHLVGPLATKCHILNHPTLPTRIPSTSIKVPQKLANGRAKSQWRHPFLLKMKSLVVASRDSCIVFTKLLQKDPLPTRNIFQYLSVVSEMRDGVCPLDV